MSALHHTMIGMGLAALCVYVLEWPYIGGCLLVYALVHWVAHETIEEFDRRMSKRAKLIREGS